MGKLGGGSLLIAGIFLVLLGALIQSDILTWLLDILGFVVVASGIILGLFGLIKLFSGKKNGASDY